LDEYIVEKEQAKYKTLFHKPNFWF